MARILLLALTLLFFSLNSYADNCRCKATDACWPDAKAWQGLREKLSGQLIKSESELAACTTDINSKACSKILKTLHNPFHLQSISGDTQSLGWYQAWTSQPSNYAVVAKDAADVALVVNFAREHHLRLVIKGTGHDYLGRSNAPDSLLIWTHALRQVNFEPSFIPTGCGDKTKAVPALTVGAGTRWLEAYDAATNQNNRYVQGGGCTSVGAAGGFIQGGGFGSFSKRFGTGAAGILEAEIVTADGQVVLANQCQNKELFWAIRGGGAGTFGVVTKVTLKTHKMPDTFALLFGKITAHNDEAFKKLIEAFANFYRDNLNNEHWGEQVRFNADNTMDLGLVISDLSDTQIRYTFSPFKRWLNEHKDVYTVDYKATIIPANKLWDYDYMSKEHPEMVTLNKEKDAPKNQFWWTTNTGEVSKYWYAYQSWWLPIQFFAPDQSKKLATTIFDASRAASVSLHFNKGLSGVSNNVAEEVRKTSTNPAVLNAAALVIISAGTTQVLPGVKGKEVNEADAKAAADKVNQAISYFKTLAPNAGTYVNEADYFQPNWQRAFWGENYSQLLAIKQKYDPSGVFYCHHCVGSEMWSGDGMCSVNQ